MTYNKLII